MEFARSRPGFAQPPGLAQPPEVAIEFDKGLPQRKVKRKPVEKWFALIYDQHEGYVSRDDFDRIQKMISQNAQLRNGTGAPKRGPALLTGLLRCRRCGRKLTVAYSGQSGRVVRYTCHRGNFDYSDSRCIALGGAAIDDAVSREVLKVVQPAATEAALMAADRTATKRNDVLEARRLELEAARYAASRAARQFDAVDPENRLVADELERRWESALEKVRSLKARIDREAQEEACSPVPDARQFEQLASDLDLVWNDPQTDIRLKKRILRTLIEEVVIDVDREAGESLLVIHWKGGVHTELRVKVRRRGQHGRQTKPEIVEAVRALTLICTDQMIAGLLNRNGLRTGHGNRWTRERVTSLRSKRGIAKYSPERQQEDGWLTREQAAAYLRLSARALARAVNRGDLEVNRPLPDGPWIFRRDELDGPKGQALVDRVKRRRRDPGGSNPEQLTLFDKTT